MSVTTLEPNRRVLLAGAFGQSNPGDEALLGAFARALPDHVLAVASAAPDHTAAAHGITAVRRDDAPAVARTLASSDAVVVAGGTIFKTLHPASGRRRHALLARTAALAVAARLRWLADDPALVERLRERTATLARGRMWPEVARTHLELYGGAK